MRKALTTRGEKTQCSSSLTKAVERKLFTELSLSRPFLSSPHSLRCPRHAPWPSLARGTCKFIVALPIHRRVRKREKGRKHWSLLSRSCGGLKATSVSLSPLPPFLTPSPSLHPILSRSSMHSQLNRTASVAAAAASRPALPVRRARLAPIAQASIRQSGLATSKKSEFFSSFFPSCPVSRNGARWRSIFSARSAEEA